MSKSRKPKKARASPPVRPSKVSSDEHRNLRLELVWVLPALVLGFLVYVNTLHGDFVYDDQRQIVRNTLIQDQSQFWRALTSDVWAFKGEDRAASNYWRPSFVLWMILNFRAFGLDTFGWHLTNILLHVAVTLLAFLFLRRLDLSRPVAGAIALIFAIHPVHVESVAWVSGAPDLILCLALLGSMWFVKALGEKRSPIRWALAIALYVVALGAKEIAVLFPLVVVGLLWGPASDSREKGAPLTRALSVAWPFALVAVLYFIVRQSILGSVQQSPLGGAGLSGTILTAPAVFTFYLRQMIVPYWIGPSYPLRVVTVDSMGVTNFLIPLIVTLFAGWWMIRMAMRSRIALMGVSLFAVTLLPAMNIAAFYPEQLVHDRYLYVPLLGFLILAIPALESLLERATSKTKGRAAGLVFAFAAIIGVALAVQTIRYNRAWLSNLALWEWGVRSDPGSAFNYQQYGVYLHEAKRLDEAITAFNRSIQISPLANAYLARATTEIDRNEFAEAERDLAQVISKEVAQVSAYTMYQAYEALAIAQTRQTKLAQAADSLAEARQRLPQYAGALTEKLSIVLYQAGQKQEAVIQLKRVRAQARTEILPESRLVFYRLGLLYAELGQPQEARTAFQEFLTLTQDTLTPSIKQARAGSEAALRNLNR
jgi:protein O-mannosyl-transferase